MGYCSRSPMKSTLPHKSDGSGRKRREKVPTRLLFSHGFHIIIKLLLVYSCYGCQISRENRRAASCKLVLILAVESKAVLAPVASLIRRRPPRKAFFLK
jgi:hypothetical protein